MRQAQNRKIYVSFSFALKLNLLVVLVADICSFLQPPCGLWANEFPLSHGIPWQEYMWVGGHFPVLGNLPNQDQTQSLLVGRSSIPQTLLLLALDGPE